MDAKLEKTVQKTIEALARIQRFIVKYGPDMSEEQMKKISESIRELQEKIRGK